MVGVKIISISPDLIAFLPSSLRLKAIASNLSPPSFVPITALTNFLLNSREEKGLSDRLIRLSVGIEHVDDLLEDLDNALS